MIPARSGDPWRGGSGVALRWAPLAAAPLAIYLAHFFFGAALNVPALSLLAVLAGLLCLSLLGRGVRDELSVMTPVWPLLLLFGMVVGFAMLSMTAAAPGGPHPIWDWVDGSPATSLNVSATLIEIIKLVGLAAVFTLGCVLGATADRARRTLQLILWLGAAYALVGLVIFLGGEQISHGGRRLAAGFYTPNAAGTQFGILAVLSLSWSIRQWRRSDREPIARRISEVGPTFAALLMFLLCLLLTASRAGLGATAPALVVVMGWEAISNRRARWPLSVAGCLLIVLAAFLFLRGNSLFIDRFGDLADAQSLRSVVYEAHWRAFLASPLSGYGLGSYAELNNQIMTAPNAGALSASVILHNVYLQWLVEAGILGAAPMFLLIAVILGVIGWRATRRPRNRGLLIGILASSLLILLHATVEVSLNTPSLEAFWALLLGLGFALSQASGARR